MKTEKDKEIDDLFKQGLEPADTHSTHMDGDWGAMEQMLDERKRRPMIIYWLPILGSVAAVLLLVIGWWLLKPVVTPKNPKEQRVAIQQPKVKTGNEEKEQQRTARNNKIDTATPPKDLSAHKEQQQTANNQAHGVKRPVDLSAGATKTAVAKTINTGKHTRMYNHAKAGRLQGNYAVNQSASLTKSQQNGPYRQNNGNLVAYSPAAVFESGRMNNSTINPANVLSQDNSHKPVYVASNKKKVATHVYKPQFAITVLASSDKNGVNSFQQAKPGNNAGVMFSVGVSKRFTISTGAIYAAKQYQTDFAGYHTNYQFPTNPTSVLANCKMFDVPLNIDYKIFNTYRNKISIGTGLSSYLMLHESYQFNYAGSGYADGPTHYNVPNPNKYLLSIVNFQVTYERQINSNVGITLQPYMKLPLSAVGASQVRLQSTGLAVGLTWNLKSSSTP